MANPTPYNDRQPLIKPVGRTKEGYTMLEVPLFMTARDIVHDHPIVLGDSLGGSIGDAQQTEEGRNDLMDRKYEESANQHGPGGGVLQSIRNNGFDPKHPIDIVPPTLHTARSVATGEPNGKEYALPPRVFNGHHRLSVMFHNYPDMPVPFTLGGRVINQTAEAKADKARAAAAQYVKDKIGDKYRLEAQKNHNPEEL
jgi:hypothetical protein